MKQKGGLEIKKLTTSRVTSRTGDGKKSSKKNSKPKKSKYTKKKKQAGG